MKIEVRKFTKKVREKNKETVWRGKSQKGKRPQLAREMKEREARNSKEKRNTWAGVEEVGKVADGEILCKRGKQLTY